MWHQETTRAGNDLPRAGGARNYTAKTAAVRQTAVLCRSRMGTQKDGFTSILRGCVSLCFRVLMI